MTQVLVSPKYQVVIPKEVRNTLHVKAGQKMSCLARGGIIYLIPDRPIASMRGFIKSREPFSLEGLREKKDREI